LDRAATLSRVVTEFDRHKILLESDKKLPSVVSLVTKQKPKGSWWGLPDGRTIFSILTEFTWRSDVLQTKLVSGKVTFVHSSLWPELLAIGTSRERWQTQNLSLAARSLLRGIEQKGEVTAVDPDRDSSVALRAAALELERRLLVHGEQFHTPGGFHAKSLVTWQSWSKEVGLKGDLPSPSSSKARFEKILSDLNERYGGSGRLPWESSE